MNGQSIVLTGLMGAGKSTVGRALADQLGYSFVDLDAEIERSARKSIPELFADEGEATFRDLETQTLRALTGLSGAVIASGGGAPLRVENRLLMRELGRIVWLNVPAATAASRVADSNRPLLQDGDPTEVLQSLLDERIGVYRDCDLEIDAAAPAETIVETIRGRLAL